ncbi:MAG: hypothetical protein AB1725_02295 [Armatimonadota bacterium]
MGSEWFYPGDGHVNVRALESMDVVAIVRPVSRQYGTRRGYVDLISGTEYPSVTTGVDTLRVLSLGVGRAGETLKSLFLHGELRGPLNPAPILELSSSNYLFAGASQRSGKVVIPDLARDPTANPKMRATAAQSPEEVGGALLLPTHRTTVAQGEGAAEVILISAAQALASASDIDTRRITDFFANLSTGPDLQRREQLEATLRELCAPEVVAAFPTLSPYAKVRASLLLVRWGHASATEMLATSLLAADVQEVSFKSASDEQIIATTYFSKLSPRPSSDWLGDLADRLRNPTFRAFLVLRMSERPSTDRVAKLVRMLDVPHTGLRFNILLNFSRWAGRDDLKPRMVNGRIDREQELIEYWRNNPPGVT